MYRADDPLGGRRGERGFTIIEMLVSLTVLAIIMGLLSGGLRVLTQNADRNAARFESMDMLSRAFDILRRDLAGLQRIATTSGKTHRYLFTGTEKKLSLVALEPPYPTAPGPYFIDYSVHINGRQAELIRARAAYRHGMLAFPGATPANRVPLITGPLDYRFAYGQKTPNSLKWLSPWPFPTRLPNLVRLEILDAKTKAAAAPPLIAAVRADAELGCLEESPSMCSATTHGELIANQDLDPDQYHSKK